MKIGILTFHRAINYGAVLQAYALQKFLQEIRPDDSVEVIDYKNRRLELIRKEIKPLSFFKHNLLRNYISFFLQFIYLSKKKKLNDVFDSFLEKSLAIGESDFTKYDLIIYGSDQIWNPVITGNDFVFLGENSDCKKIAYAASDGGQLQCGSMELRLLQKYSFVFLREKSLEDKLKALHLNNVKTVCDPVFLLKKKQWEGFADKPNEKNYILVYKVADNKSLDDEASRFGKAIGKKVIYIEYVRSIKKAFAHTEAFVEAITPQQFVGYFFSADFVLTTSFHGTAFSIILEKKFYCLKMTSRSERIKDLLKQIHLEARYVESVPQYKDVSMYSINYESIRPIIISFINESKFFLEDAINNG